MPQDTDFTTFVALVDVIDPDAQNVQELASIWGDVREEFREVGATIEASYAVLGQFDFLVIFEVPSTEAAFEADVILERHGLAVQTMEVIDTEAFADLVADL